MLYQSLAIDRVVINYSCTCSSNWYQEIEVTIWSRNYSRFITKFKYQYYLRLLTTLRSCLNNVICFFNTLCHLVCDKQLNNFFEKLTIKIHITFLQPCKITWPNYDWLAFGKRKGRVVVDINGCCCPRQSQHDINLTDRYIYTYTRIYCIYIYIYIHVYTVYVYIYTHRRSIIGLGVGITLNWFHSSVLAWHTRWYVYEGDGYHCVVFH